MVGFRREVAPQAERAAFAGICERFASGGGAAGGGSTAAAEALLDTLSFYHGTRAELVGNIQREGLIPRARAGADLAAGIPDSVQNKGTRRSSVYMTLNQRAAVVFAKVTADRFGGEPVVLEIRVPREQANQLDEDEHAVPGLQAVRFVGRIPPAWIHVLPRDVIETWLRLLLRSPTV